MKRGGVAKIISEQDIRRAMAITKSNFAASKFLNVYFQTYRKYAKMYIDEETGKNLWELHKNQCGKGITRFRGNYYGQTGLDKILTGEITNVEKYDIGKFKNHLINNFVLHEECSRCKFNEKRLFDYRVPLLINFKDKNTKNWREYNLEFLCYNCYYLTIGDVFNKRQLKQIEDAPSEKVNKNTPRWDLDEHMVQHLKELGLNMDEDKDDIDDFTAYKNI